MTLDRFILALLVSCLIHLSGSIAVSIKGLEGMSPLKMIDVGMVQTEWSDRWINLPGGGGEDKAMFKKTSEIESEKSGKLISRQAALELPEAASTLDSNIDDIWTNPARLFEDFSSVREGLIREKEQDQNIQGPVSERKVLFRLDPVYPEWALQYGVEFEVKVKFWVSSVGEVSDAYVESSSGYPEVDAKVVRSVKKWRFNEVESRVGLQWGMIKFKFRLKHSR